MVLERVHPRSKRQRRQRQPENLESIIHSDDSASLNGRTYPDGRLRKVSIGLSATSSKSRAKAPVRDANPTLPFLNLPELEDDIVLKKQKNETPANLWESVLDTRDEICCSPRKGISVDNPVQGAVVARKNVCASSHVKDQIQAACNKNPVSEPFKNINAQFVPQNAHLSYEEIPSARFVRVYAKRSSVRMGQTFDATSESTLIRYESKRTANENKKVLKEFAFQKTEEVKSCKRQIAGHVRFSFSGDPNPKSNPVWNKGNKVNSNGKDSNEIALRMKLRNALGSINSSQKLDCREENFQREEAKSNSDTIEAESEESDRTAKAVKGAASPFAGGRLTRTTAKSLSQGQPRQAQLNIPNRRTFCTNDYNRRYDSSSNPPPGSPHAGKVFSFDEEECGNVNLCPGESYNRKSRRKNEDPDQSSPPALHEERSHHSPPEKLPSTVTEVPEQITNLNELVDAKTWTSDKEKSLSPSPSVHEDINAHALPVKEEMQIFIEAESNRRSSRASLYKSPRELSCRVPRRPRVKRNAGELSLSPDSKGKSNESTDSDPSAKSTEDDHGDDLFGAIKQLAIILKKFKQKVIIERNRKVSQILECASETIHTELLKIESQIQSDLVKHTNVCKTKYRDLEANLQDQNKKLKLIQEQFRNDVAQHLQVYTSTLSQIEGQQIELKSISERQKASHRKLLSQADELMESQLVEAEEKISAAHKVARSNLLGLKHALDEYFG